MHVLAGLGLIVLGILAICAKPLLKMFGLLVNSEIRGYGYTAGREAYKRRHPRKRSK